MGFSKSELERYSRQIALRQVGEKGQEKLKAARVLLVGAGGLGNPAALYLAAAGVGHLGLIDYDRVSLSNLQRQILYSAEQIGESKVGCAKKSLLRVNSEVEVYTYDQVFSSLIARQLIQTYDIVVDCTDRFSSRYLVNDACFFESKPLVTGSVSQFDAQINVFNYQKGPCYRCIYPDVLPTSQVLSRSEGGVLGVLPGVVGTLMVAEILKLILGIGKSLSGKVLVYDLLQAEFKKFSLEKNDACELCGVRPTIVDLSAHMSREASLGA
jgi:molybdopterin/thiamine biosynthesis adenylyltransferase